MSRRTNGPGPKEPSASAAASDGIWDFSVSFYGQKQVRETCLGVQDRFGADVNLLLFCVWLGVTGRGRLSDDDLAQLSAAVSLWQSDVVKPLRAARIKLRTPPPAVPAAAAEALREQVQKLELDAERIELEVLAQCLERPPVAHDRARRLRDVADSLAAYFNFLDVPASEDITEAIDRLIDDCP